MGGRKVSIDGLVEPSEDPESVFLQIRAEPKTKSASNLQNHAEGEESENSKKDSLVFLQNKKNENITPIKPP